MSRPNGLFRVYFFKIIIMTNEQKQLTLSALLGDGYVAPSGSVNFNCMYKEYMDYKKELGGSLSLDVVKSGNLGYKKGSDIYSFSLKRSPEAKDIYNLPLSESLKDLDELGLALWVMDDGSLHKKNYFYNINTHSFPKEIEENVLIPLLNNFKIYPEIMTEKKKDGRVFSYLYVSKYNGAIELSRILRKYIVGCYSYKLLPKKLEDAYFETKEEEGFLKCDTPLRKTNYIKNKYNLKSLRHFEEDNVKNIEMPYKELIKKWEKRFKGTRLVYSAFDVTDDKKDIVKSEYNFMDKNPIVKGSYFLTIPTWKYESHYYESEGRNLTWDKLISEIEEHGDNRHIFLEYVDVKNNNNVSVFLGS